MTMGYCRGCGWKHSSCECECECGERRSECVCPPKEPKPTNNTNQDPENIYRNCKMPDKVGWEFVVFMIAFAIVVLIITLAN